MNILLLGGSNAGMRNGWAAQLQEKACGHNVENRFLGAVGSLYGLMALMKHFREGEAAPDLIVFEYCLNDILLVEAGVLAAPLIADALEAVVDICATARLPLLFLCLAPRPDAQARASTRRVTRLYERAASRAGAPILRVSEIFENSLAASDFQDENHLTPQASARVADAVLQAVEAGVPAMRDAGEIAPRFEYVDATRARAQGPYRILEIQSRVFRGPFLELARGASSLWPGRNALVGLMLQSTAASGDYLIRANGRSYRKSPCSQMQETVQNLMLLHYTTRRIEAAGEVEIAMPEDEGSLMRAPEDKTLLAVPATAPFAEQTLLIHGLMFWRPRTVVERIRAAFAR